MRKLLLASAAIVGLAFTTLVPHAFAAVTSEPVGLSEAQIQAMQDNQSVLLEAHLVGMKAGLKLNDEQARLWPAFEGAIRDTAKARWDRTRGARARMAKGERPSSLERLDIMADHLEKSAQELRKVVDAAKPLYESLTETQKRDFGPLMRQFKPNRHH